MMKLFLLFVILLINKVIGIACRETPIDECLDDCDCFIYMIQITDQTIEKCFSYGSHNPTDHINDYVAMQKLRNQKIQNEKIKTDRELELDNIITNFSQTMESHRHIFLDLLIERYMTELVDRRKMIEENNDKILEQSNRKIEEIEQNYWKIIEGNNEKILEHSNRKIEEIEQNYWKIIEGNNEKILERNNRKIEEIEQNYWRMMKENNDKILEQSNEKIEEIEQNYWKMIEENKEILENIKLEIKRDDQIIQNIKLEIKRDDQMINNKIKEELERFKMKIDKPDGLAMLVGFIIIISILHGIYGCLKGCFNKCRGIRR